jgi:hypothetical protein
MTALSISWFTECHVHLLTSSETSVISKSKDDKKNSFGNRTRPLNDKIAAIEANRAANFACKVALVGVGAVHQWT